MTTPIPGTTPRAWPPPQLPAAETQTVGGYGEFVPNASAHTDARVADFSYKPRPLYFTMDGDRYDCHPTISPAIAQDIAHLTKRGLGLQDVTPDNVDQAMDSIGDVFRVIMRPESAERFIQRLTGRENPLDINHQVLPVLQWLLEQYGLRPTQPSPESSAGSSGETAGTSSTGGVPPAESTPPG